MRFADFAFKGVRLVEIVPHEDARGFFARTFCEAEFAAKNLVSRFAQSSVSFNARGGTVRGMHFSAPPHAETKLVRCTAGAIYDVIVDIRRDSSTYLQAAGIELSSTNRRALYIPVGVAHGFQALVDDTEVLYAIDKPYVESAARGIRWNDCSLKIEWPQAVTVISEADLKFPDWAP